MAAPALGVVLVLALAGLTPLIGDDGTVDTKEDESDQVFTEPTQPEPTATVEPAPATPPPPPESQGPTQSVETEAFAPSFTLDPDDAGPWTAGSLMEALAFGLADSDLEPYAVRDLLVDYMHRSGLPVPASGALDASSGPSSRPHFEANDTLMFSYNIGDATGDGVDDVAINAFCVAPPCFQPTLGDPGGTVPPEDPNQGAQNCGVPQQLYAKGGRDGSLIWDMDLSRQNKTAFALENPLAFCPIDTIMGTIPVGPQSMELADGELPPTGAENNSALLVYSLAGFYPRAVQGLTGSPTLLLLQHEVYALDPQTGERLWTHTEEGQVVMWNGCFIAGDARCSHLGSRPLDRNGDKHNSKFVRAENLLVNPLLMIPKDAGVQIQANATPALFLQGVSFEYEVLGVYGGLPPGHARGGIHMVDDYRPNEWLGRLDLNTGEFMWQEPSITPENEKSVMPFLINTVTPGAPFTHLTGYQYEANTNDPWRLAYPSGIGGHVGVAALNYWSQSLCCFDISGDGIPDLVYTTHEWDPIQLRTEQGGFLLDSRIIAFSGADGSRLWEQVIAEDVPRFMIREMMAGEGYRTQLEIVGDANGDGFDDIMLNKFYMQDNMVHEIEIRSGQDGSLIWGIRSGTHKLALPMGDTNGDGSSDVAIIEWYDWELPRFTFYNLANVTAHPIEVRSGADGSVLWETRSFNAPLDLFYILDGFKTSGLLDLNGDGAVDIPIDDPFLLPDGTMVHQWSFLSGATGKVIHHMRTPGTFSFPAWAGDTNGDGIDDVLILSGETVDIWTTLYDGTSGQAMWSQRLLTTNVLDFTLAVPRIGMTALNTPAGQAPLLTFQLLVSRVLDPGSGGRYTSTFPQVAAFPSSGTQGWSHPRPDEPTKYRPILGATPGAALLEEAIRENGKSSLMATYESQESMLWKGVAPSIGAFLASTFLTFKTTLWTRRRRRAVIGEDAEW